jgi:hypothetical protein
MHEAVQASGSALADGRFAADLLVVCFVEELRLLKSGGSSGTTASP